MISSSPLKKDIFWFLSVAATALFLTVSINLPHLSSYAVMGDSYALLLYSSRFFEISPIKWFIEGYRYYSLNYPEASSNFTYVIRSTSNIFVYLTSLIADSPNSVIFLLCNYIGHSLACALVYVFSRAIVRLRVASSLLAAFLFLGSTSAYELLHNMAFGVDMMAALLGMLALMMMYVYVNHFRNWLVLTSTVFLLMLSVFAKETGIVAPVVVAVYFIVEELKKRVTEKSHRFSLGTLIATIRKSWRVIALILFPSFAYVLYILSLRLIFATGWATYASVGTPFSLLKRPFRFLLIFLYPLDIGDKPLGPALHKKWNTDLIGFSRECLAIILNLVSLSLLIFLLRKKKYRIQLSYFLVLAVIALTVPIFLVPFARFMYFGQMLCLPIFVYGVSRFNRESRSNYQKIIAIGVLIAAVLINPVYSLYRLTSSQDEIVTYNYYAREFQTILSEEIKNSNVHRLYLINDITGTYGSLSQLKYLASLAGRKDVTLRVVNSLGCDSMVLNSLGCYNPNSSIEGEGVDVKTVNDELLVSIQLGEGEALDFPSVPPENLAKLGVEGIISYDFGGQLKNYASGTKEIQPLKKLTVSIPDASRKDYLLIGFDPSEPGVHILRPNDTKWHVASSSKSFSGGSLERGIN